MIGGGAAGILAAWRTATLGVPVLLLEKNSRLGLKLRISGGGKCNITHDGSMRDVRQAFQENEARFLGPAFARFSNREVLELVTSRGIEVYTRPDGRVFPSHAKADDVVAALGDHLRASGAAVRFDCPVQAVTRDGDGFRLELPNAESLTARRLIVAVGGCSYPKTGTTGDGYRWLRALGHTVTSLRSALAPLYLREPRPDYSGLALRDCLLRARAGHAQGKEAGRWRGDLLYTHQGVSGPAALGVSRAVALAMEQGEVVLEVDLFPDAAVEQLTAGLVQAHGHAGHRSIRRWLEERVPDRLVPELLERCGVDPATPLHRLPKVERNRLVQALKAWNLGPVRGIPMERGEVTAGGVALEEVDPQTMESRLIPDLYLCGEILDIAGPVGGYNLQAAFSTGYVAGDSAARGFLATG